VVRPGARLRLAIDLVVRWRGEHVDLIRGMLALRHDRDVRVRGAAGVRQFGAAVAPVLDVLLAELNVRVLTESPTRPWRRSLTAHRSSDPS